MRSFKFYVFTIILSLLGTQTYGQITIDGTVTDSELNPISDALVEIIDETDTNNIFSDVTDASGNFSISNITDIGGRPKLVPTNHIVLRNYPNPFNPTTMIYFELPRAENIEIKIYDILGREIRTLYSRFHKAGTYTMSWDGRNDWNSPVAAGIYFCRLKTKDQFKVHKMVLLDGGSNASSLNNAKLAKPRVVENIAKANSIFSFSVKVSGSNILASDFKYFSCSTDTTLNLIVPKILQTAIIGPEGGKLEIDGFSLTIPAAAFDDNTEIRIFDKHTNEWDTNNASKIFGVAGLPYYFDHPLNIEITPNTDLTDESYIAVGQDYQVPSSNTIEPIYKFLETEDSLGKLSCQLLPDSSFNNGHLGKQSARLDYFTNKMFFTAKTGYKHNYSLRKHFKIYMSAKTDLDVIIAIANLSFSLESIFDSVKSAGDDRGRNLDYIRRRMKKLRPILSNRGCDYAPTYNTKNMILLLDENRNLEENLNDPIIMREYSIGITRTYDKEFFIPLTLPRKINPKRYWFHHAVGCWFESTNRGFPPFDYYTSLEDDGSYDNYFAPFRGMQYGAIKTSYGLDALPDMSLRHGGGMSSFIKYIVNDYGKNFIPNIYELIKKENLHPIDAVKKLFADSYLWWPNYIQKVLDDILYPFQGYIAHGDGVYPVYFLTDEYEFEDKNDTIKTFYKSPFSNFVSLSAEGYQILWDSKNIDTTRIMKISLKENENSFLVYADNFIGMSYPDKFLGKGQEFSIKIADLLSQNFMGLWVFVTNSESEPPYLNKSDFKLEVKLEKPKELRFKYCDINFAVIEMHDTLEGVWSPGWYTVGSFKDNIFDGIINTEKQGGNANGTIRIEVDNNQNILSLDVMAYHSDPTGYSSQWGFTAQNIPPTENEPYLLVYSYLGYNVCNYVKSIYAKYIEVDGDELELTRFKCDPESVLHIKFHNWD